MLNSNTTILVVILTSLGTLLPLSTNKAFINEVDAEEPQQLSTSMLHDIITVQNTSMSVQLQMLGQIISLSHIR
jgi:hypothetical protein